MAFQPEVVQWENGVYQIETADPVQGGVGGTTNVPHLQLSNRTAYLKKHLDDLEAGLFIPEGFAVLNSPVFTGTPTVPTAASGNNSLQIANTKFVQDTVYRVLSKSIAGGVNVSLTNVEAGYGTLVFTGVLTANIAVIVPATAKSWVVSNKTSGAFTVTVKTAAGTGVAVSQGKSVELTCDGTNVGLSTNDFVDVPLTGTPTAPTPATADNTTKVATTAFAQTVHNGIASVNVAGSASVTLTAAQYGAGILNLSGALTGNINLIVPAQSGQWIIANGATGGFNITAKTPAGTGVILPQGLAVVVYSDGVNVYLASSAGQNSFKPQAFAPAAGTTTLTITGGYTPGNILVEKNGAWLTQADYTATTSPDVVLTAPTIAGDQITVYAFSSFSVADAVKKSGDIMTGPLTMVAGSTAPTPDPTSNDTSLINSLWAKVGFAVSIGAIGYLKFPTWLGGLIFQWGYVLDLNLPETVGSGAVNATITFPLPFPNNCFRVIHSNIDYNGIGLEGMEAGSALGSSTKTGCIIKFLRLAGSNSAGTERFGVEWFAVGN